MTSRRSSAFLAFVLAVQAVGPAIPTAMAQVTDPKQATQKLAEADKAARLKKWDDAARLYHEAKAFQPSLAASLGLANARYQAGQAAEAYLAYEEVLGTAKLTAAQKAEAEKRLQELAAKTGEVTLHADEAGASISWDGVVIGTSPMAKPFRASPGTHRLKISKEAFLPFEQSIDVAAAGRVSVDARLVRQSAKGTLVVREKTGQAVRLIVDGLDVGAVPFDGPIDPGRHELLVRNSTAAAPSRTVDVVAGAKIEIEFEATAAVAKLEIKTSDGQGFILIDGKPVSEGAFSGDVPVGPHVLEVKREGYDSYRENLSLADKQTYAEVVTLKRTGAPSTGAAVDAERDLSGIYGGFTLNYLKQLGSLGSELDNHCNVLGATTCETPSPYGGGLTGYIGYTWDPVGFELMAGGMVDTTQQKAIFDGSTQSGQNPLVATPARTEEFTFLRFGGLGALRVRGTVQSKRLRGSLAAGIGLAYRHMLMEKKSASKDGNLQDIFVPGGISYVSPAISVDASVGIRLTQGFAISAGATLWAETAGSSASFSGDGQRLMGGSVNGVPTATPIATPRYQFATDAQIFFGPYLGFQFGP